MAEKLVWDGMIRDKNRSVYVSAGSAHSMSWSVETNLESENIWKIPEPIPKQFCLLEGYDNQTICERKILLQELSTLTLSMIPYFSLERGSLVSRSSS